MNKSILTVLIFCLAASVQAQTSGYGEAVRQGEITSGGSGQGPGGLTARDVVGKRLLDADGNPVGRIESVSSDGTTATVGGGGGKRTVDMSQLSLGMGANTVIEHSNSSADSLNARQSFDFPEGKTTAVTTTTTTDATRIRQGPPQTTTTTTVTERTNGAR